VIKGKHCIVQYYSTNDNVIAVPPDISDYNYDWKEIDKRFGGAVCIPASCSSDIIPSLMKQIFNGTDLQLATDYQQEHYCQIREHKNMKIVDYFARLKIVERLSHIRKKLY
jgi:hypothetical protein